MGHRDDRAVSGRRDVDTRMDPRITAQPFNAAIEQEESVFRYLDTTSSRAGIVKVTDKLRRLRIGIIGLGGTGSYKKRETVAPRSDDQPVTNREIFKTKLAAPTKRLALPRACS